MIEDDIYRTSTQYRLWSFTPDSLQTIRNNTNIAASERVRIAVRQARIAREQPAATDLTAGNGAGSMAGEDANAGAENIECLTPEEEYELVQYYCEKTMDLGNEYKPSLPSAVKATAIQYLRRFYLTNSPMTYHPKSIMPCALFLATKTENYYMSLRSFTEKIPNASPEDIIAPEFLLTQGLRFTFDVRHPFRGLEGGMFELDSIALGGGLLDHRHPEQSEEALLQALEELPWPSSREEEFLTVAPHSATSSSSRLRKAHLNAREIIKNAGQLTDVYFLYTPSQIWLSALLIADKAVANFYLDVKIGPFRTAANDSPPPLTSDGRGAELLILRSKIATVLKSCTMLLFSYMKSNPPQQTFFLEPRTIDPVRMRRLKQIGKKLYRCQNPEKIDLTALNRQQMQARTPAPLPQGSLTASSSSSATPSVAEGHPDHITKRRRLEG